MVSQKIFKASLMALVVSTGVAGCATTATDLDLPQATAHAETFRSEFVVDPRDNGLTWAQQSQLEMIADQYKARGHGPLVISYPQGAANQQAAMHAIAEARNYLYAAGLDWRQIRGGAYDAQGAGNGSLVFSFTQYEAVAPDCRGWDNLAVEIDNRRSDRFGCFMAANLAATVADPRDLIAPRTMEAADGERRQTVLDRYRAGQSTASERSDYESGAVSQVGN
ncbi:MAG: CpaD family pilus assembly protein [Pseudomonadota bacterium]|nr:CpaD family pilus assembly protein [Pseudomonadota bacterium]